MAGVSFEVQGATRLSKKFDRAAREYPQVVDNRMDKWGSSTASKIKKKRYPRKRPGQRYKRTFTLKRSWQHRRIKRLVHAIINDARQKGKTYPVWVVGDALGRRQAWMHKDRWWTGRGEVENELPALVSGLKTDVRKIF